MTLSDEPIASSERDLLNRTGVAIAIANEIISSRNSPGFRVGITGPWGSGKTSLLVLIREEIDKNQGVLQVDFRPWNVKGVDNLLNYFFSELQRQLQPGWFKYNRLSNAIESYAKLASDLHNSLGFFARLLGHFRSRDLDSRRKKLEVELNATGKMIVVYIDDLDRLEPDEIFEIFRLVRLIGHFQQVVYVLAFDMGAVQHAIDVHFGPRSNYLDKFVQLHWSLPEIADEIRLSHLTTIIDSHLEGLEAKSVFDKAVWNDSVVEVVLPLVVTIRDAKRLSRAVRVALIRFEDQIDLGDLIVLESIRLFLPAVHSQLVGLIDLLTDTGRHMTSGGRSGLEQQSQVDKLLQMNEPNSNIIKSLIRRLFPAANDYIGGPVYGSSEKRNWLEARHVAHRDVLSLYLQDYAGPGLRAAQAARQVIDEILQDTNSTAWLSRTPSNELPNLVFELGTCSSNISPEAAASVLRNLIANFGAIPKGSPSFLGVSGWGALHGSFRRMFAKLYKAGTGEALLEQILGEIDDISITTVVLRSIEALEVEDAGIDTKGISILTLKCKEEAIGSTIAKLLSSSDLYLIMHWLHMDDQFKEKVEDLVKDRRVGVRVICDSISEAISHSFVSRTEHRSPKVHTESLSKLFGGTEALTAFVENSLSEKQYLGDSEIEALNLVKIELLET